MALPITPPYTFANVTVTQNLSYLDSDFATVYNAVNGIGNGTVALANVNITGGTISANVSATSIHNGTSNVSVDSSNGPVSINTAGTNAMYIDTSQNVGIGTTSPAAKLDVRGSSSFLVNATNPTAWISVDSALTTGSMYNQWNTSSNIGISGTYTNHAYTFVTNNTERMRIDSSGNLLVNTTSGTAKVYIKSTSNTSPTAFVIERSDTTDKWGQIVDSSNNYYFNLNGTGKGYINNSTGAYTAVSDRRLKKNIVECQYGLNEILKFRPVEYNMIDEDNSAKKHIGLIAQEVKSVIDNAVDDLNDENAMYGTV